MVSTSNGHGIRSYADVTGITGAVYGINPGVRKRGVLLGFLGDLRKVWGSVQARLRDPVAARRERPGDLAAGLVVALGVGRFWSLWV